MNTKQIRILMCAAVLSLFTFSTQAQTTLTTTPAEDAMYDKGFRLGFGIAPGYVFEEPYDFALGADVRLQYDFSQRYSITLTTGFTNLFAGDVNNVEVKDLGFIPLKAGFKAFIWEQSFYLMGEAGAGFPVTNDYKKTSAIVAPSIGWANDYFDLSLRYEYYSDFPSYDNTIANNGASQLALRFAYGFRL